MRVLIVSDTADVRNGGACIQLWNLRRLLESGGHEVRVFSFDGDDAGDVARGWTSVAEPASRPARKFAKLTTYPRGARALRDVVRGFDPDLVHVNSNFKYPGTVFRALRGRKVLASARDYVWICPTGWAVRKDDLEPCPGGAGLQCVRHGCKSAPEMALFQGPLALVRDPLAREVVARFLAPSRRLAESLRAHGFRAEALPNPVALTADASPAPTAPREPVILYVGAIEEKKGVGVLLRAFVRAAAEHPELRLELAGKGAWTDRLAREATVAGLASRVRFHGHVGRDEVRALYRKASALVCPSLWMENFPNVVYEAMAHDCPVIGSDRGGIAELLADDRGFLYPAKDGDALAAHLARVTREPELAARQAGRARRFVETELAERKFLAEYLRHAAEITGLPVALASDATAGGTPPTAATKLESERPAEVTT
ncbi:MAG: glycosyltransferase family 4 protein [Gemmatimonadetes bacterium]|nr:glycosyltransferase family 4 protein [Gemmatimonadota bacterium]